MIRQKKQLSSRFVTLLGYFALGVVTASWPRIGHFGAQTVINSTTVRSVPASYVRDVSAPGTGQSIRRPTALHYDRWHKELLVADAVGNRILIFQPSGTFLYSFSLSQFMTSPQDIATDPQGAIYVLGAVQGGSLVYSFDFDGLPLAPVAWTGTTETGPPDLRSLACDDVGRLYGLDHDGLRIVSCWPDGRDERSFSLTEQVGRQAAQEQVLGSLTWADGELLVPVSSLGTVLRYTPDGEYLGSIGHQGSVTGALNFPVAAEVTPEGLVLVLDKNRFNVACFDREGRFLGEFGGKGLSPGWFFQPSLLAVPAPDRVAIGQIFQNKIQICALPSFARAPGEPEGLGQGGDPWRGDAPAEPSADDGSPANRRSAGSNSFASSLREVRTSQDSVVTLLEVSE